MEEIKVSLTIVLPGSAMFKKEECIKTVNKTIEKVNKKTGKKYKKNIEVQVESYDKVDKNSIKVSDKGGVNSEIITFTTRKCKPATQSLNINKEAFLDMMNKDSCPAWIKKNKWISMGKKERLESHLQRIMEHFNGLSYTYQVFDD